MARSSAQLVEESTVDPAAPFGFKKDGTPAKRRMSGGPRKVKPIRILYRAVDSSGQIVEGIKLDVVYVGRDSDQVSNHLERDPGLKVARVEVSKEETE